MVRCCCGTKCYQERQMFYIRALCSLSPAKRVLLRSDVPISSKCLKGDQCGGNDGKEPQATKLCFQMFLLTKQTCCIHLVKRQWEEWKREEARPGRSLDGSSIISKRPGENSLRLPVGGGIDVSHESPPCGAPRFTRMFSWVPAKASRESSENIFFYQRKLVALLFVLFSLFRKQHVALKATVAA